jgi:CRP-like cAMP-binding protein
VLELSPPRGLGERLLALRGFPLLSGLPPADLAHLARLSRDHDFSAGAALAIEGQPVRAAQLVVSGRVDLWRANELVRRAGPFEVVGLPAIAAGVPQPFTARAAEPVHALEVDAGLVADVLEDDSRLFVEVLRLAARAASSSDRGLARPASDPPRPGAERTAGCLTAPLDAARRLMAVHGADLFRHAPVDGLAALARRLEVGQLAPGQPMSLTGPGELTVIVEGHVTLPAAGGRAAASAGPGTVLGLVEALAGTPPLAGVRALSPVVVLRAALADLLDVLDDHHAMGRRLLAELVTLSLSVR